MASGRSPAPPISICSRAQFSQTCPCFGACEECRSASPARLSYRSSSRLRRRARPPPKRSLARAPAHTNESRPGFPKAVFGAEPGWLCRMPRPPTKDRSSSVAVHTCCTIADECGWFPATPKAFTCNAIPASCRDRAIDWHFIAPGKPIQKGNRELQRRPAQLPGGA